VEVNGPIERAAKAIQECKVDIAISGYVPVARSAMEAVREPSEGMIEAGADLMIGLVLEGREKMVAKQVWQVMHAAMLAKVEESP
jgi:hypothetical protein